MAPLGLQHIGVPSLIVSTPGPIAWFRKNLSREIKIVATGNSRLGALALKEALDRLRNGGVVVMAADGGDGKKDITLPFLGRQMKFTRGMAVLSRLTGAPILPALATWGDCDWTFDFHLFDPVTMPPMGYMAPHAWEREVVAATVRRFEEIVKATPGQCRLDILGQLSKAPMADDSGHSNCEPFRTIDHSARSQTSRAMDSKAHFNTALQRFVGAPRLPASDLRRVQMTKLRDLLRHTVDHVTLYRDLYRKHGVTIDAIADGEDLWRLPSVAKDDYLNAGPIRYIDERLDLGTLKTRTTSGSLGRALAMFATEEEDVRLRASLWSAWLSLGITHQDRLFMMAAPYLERPLPPIQSDFAPVQMSVEETIGRFRALQPTAVIGSVECIALLASEARRRDLPERHGVRRIFPFGQTMSRQLKEMIQAGFAAEIFNLYGANESTWIGCECERHDGLHVTADRTIVQVARFGHPDQPAAPGEVGEVIITSLMRRTTPFIRYRLQDAAALDPTPCPCGRSSPRLKSLEGRVQDFLISTRGQWIGPGAIAIDLSAGQKAIVDHRVVQEARHRVRVSIVPGAGFGTPDCERIEQVVRRHLGEVTVAIDLVHEIPREASGKRRRIFRAFDLEMSA